MLPAAAQVWPVAGDDGAVDGVLLTLDAHPRLRLCTNHLDWRDLTDDRDATGTAGALAVLRTVAAILDALTADAAAAHRDSR